MKKQNLKTKNPTSHFPPHTSKGITLIALIITIIIMLILAAVSITMAVNGGLFGYAQNASQETEQTRKLEQKYASLGDDMTYDDLIIKYSEIPKLTVTMYGDVNVDNILNSDDVDDIQKYLTPVDSEYHIELEPQGILNADVNLDGIVDNTDVHLIQRAILRETNPNYITLPYTGE